MLIRYDFKIKLKDFGLFLLKIAKINNVNYKLYYEDDEFSLVIDDNEDKVLAFNEYFKKIPYFLFLEDFKIELENTQKTKEFEIEIPRLPLNLCDEVFDNLGLNELDYTKTTKSDFVIIANYELLQKAFICDKNTQILLNAYEKPFVKLALKPLYKKAHNLGDFLYVSFANSKKLFNELKNADELYFVKKPKDLLLIAPFADTFCVINNPYSNQLSTAFNIDKLSFNVPKNKDELIKLLLSLEQGEKLLKNYQEKFILNEFSLENKNIFSLIKLADILLDSNILKVVPNTYTKGVRIDCEINEDGLNVAKFISSIMSFRLANAALIEVGVFEALVLMIGKLNENEREICSKLMNYQSFLNYNAFLNKQFKFSQWANCECFN